MTRYMVPPVVTHLGDTVMATTKPEHRAGVKFTFPKQHQIVIPAGDEEPLHIQAWVEGMVYDAEYSWILWDGQGECHMGKMSARADRSCRRACTLSLTSLSHLSISFSLLSRFLLSGSLFLVQTQRLQDEESDRS